MPRWLVVLLFIVLGIVSGLAYGWLIDPVKFLDTTPASLRADYRTDYVLMVAESYHARQDSQLAAKQLAILGGVSPAAICAGALQVAQGASYSQGDVALLLELSRAMQALSPASLPAGSP
jgi:hypothetical protein